MKKREKYVKIISFTRVSNLMFLEFGLAHVSSSPRSNDVSRAHKSLNLTRSAVACVCCEQFSTWPCGIDVHNKTKVKITAVITADCTRRASHQTRELNGISGDNQKRFFSTMFST